MIPVFDLKRQYDAIKPEIDQAVSLVLNHGMFTLGTQVASFENEFAAYLDINHAIGVASGTDSLMISLKTLDIKSGDEVIIPANAYPTVFGVALSGCRIRLADCGPDGNIDLADLERKLSKKTKVVVPVHLYGNPADVIGIKILLNNRKSGAYILEDAAQAHGAQIKDGSVWRKAGTIGDVGIFSFYPSKNLGAYGDGGMIVTDRSAWAARIRALRMYGEINRYHSNEISGVSRLDELQAAVLSVKLKHLDRWNRQRQKIVEYYYEELNKTGDLRFLNYELRIKNYEFNSCHHLFVVRTKKRDKLQKFLTKEGIGCGIHYPVPVNLIPAFRGLGYKKGDFPEAEAQSREVLSLPLFPELSDAEAERVVAAVKRFFRN